MWRIQSRSSELIQAMSQQETFHHIKEYLTNSSDDGKGKPLPAGAVQSILMTLQPEPKNSFDEVYPSLVLGNWSIAKDKQRLKDEGITHIVNCAMGTKFNQIDTNQEFFEDTGIKFHGIKAINVAAFKMLPHFEPAAAFINEAVKSGGRVYVHCRSGVSRSASIVLAFLMLKRSMGIKEAVKCVRDKREIFPNDGFLKQLCALNESLYGKSMMI